jgi:3-mercaptopyruvate sulfurtransferase SseA
MKELNRTDRLTIASLIAVSILAIGLLTIKWNELRFTRSVEQSIPLINSSQEIIYPEDVASIVESGDQAYLLVDLRSPSEFYKSHIGSARNIPVQNILDDKNLRLFRDLAKDSVTVVLYAGDQLQANSAWVMLKQLNLDNIKVMPGGFSYYSNSSLDMYDLPAVPEYMVEEPKYDYWGVLDSLSGDQPAGQANINAGEPLPVIKKDKKTKSEGGC